MTQVLHGRGWIVGAAWILSFILILTSARTSLAAPNDQAPPLPAPSGNVVYVSTEGQLQSAIQALSSNTTIVIAAGTYSLSRTLYIGNVTNVTVRGASNNRDDVVLAGKGMSNANYGAVLHGIWISGRRITIANLTIRDVYQHPIIFNAGAENPRIYNVRLIDAGQQFIKSNPDGAGGGVDAGVVEYSLFEYQTTARDYYTNGVDVHTGTGWIVRNNLFRNLQAPSGQLAGPAVLIWNSSRDSIVEGNTFINCQREIALGLEPRTPNDHSGGIVRNNFIYRRPSMYADVAISAADSPNTQILHNTIFVNGTYPYPIEYRFGDTKGVVIRNNLLDGQIWARDGAMGSETSNYKGAVSSMFVNAAAGDLHLAATATLVIDRVAALINAAADWDRDGRPQGAAADYGADEYKAPAPPPPNQPPSVALTSPSNGATYTAPATVTVSATAGDTDGTIARVDFFAGSTVIGSDTTSPYSVSWSGVTAGTYALTAVARDNAGASGASASVNITVNSSPGTGLPSPWTERDIGNPALTGSAAYASGTFTVKGGGADIWGTSDQFHFAYQTLDGDGEIVARVASIQNTDGWAKAGVMFRANLTGVSRNVMALVSAMNGLSFQRRVSNGSASTSTSGGIAGAAPYWLRLVRTSNTFTAYRSTNGTSWTVMGSDTVSMSSLVYVGLAVTSHNASALTTGTLTNVTVKPAAPSANQPPSVTLTAPLNGSTYMATGHITVGASASDPDGPVATVNFYAGSTLIGSDAVSPYSITWSNVPAGSYTLTAVAADSGGASTTSSGVSITVTAGATLPRQVVFTASTDHATNVTSYTLDVFTSGANPSSATPTRSQNLGKPPVVSGDIGVDISQLILGLPAGSYFTTVTAVGPGGTARSAPSNVFTR